MTAINLPRHSRLWLMPDELMVMKADRQFLLVETNYPIVAKRVAWFNDPALKLLGRNLKG